MAILLFAFTSITLCAEEKPKFSYKKDSGVYLTGIYGDFAVLYSIPGNLATASLGLNLFLENLWGGGIHYDYYSREAASLPSDYRPGFCLFGDCSVFDDVESVGMNITKYFESNSALVRFAVAAGPVYIRYHKAYFTPNNHGGIFSTNYYVDYKVFTSFGAGLSGKIEFPLSRYAGLQINGTVNLNQFQSYYGFGAGIILGLLRTPLN